VTKTTPASKVEKYVTDPTSGECAPKEFDVPETTVTTNEPVLQEPYVVTNWVQLPTDADKKTKWMTKCPEKGTWVLPVDTAMPADKGSFKGYTNRYTFSAVNDDLHVKGTKVAFANESEGYAEWSEAAKIGCIGGFGVFGLAIIIVVFMIFVDMRRRMAMYEELIADDLNKLQQMGLGGKMKEMNVELAARLAGGKEDVGVDDQLVTQALELGPSDFAKHM
jgi:hypothetical protein